MIEINEKQQRREEGKEGRNRGKTQKWEEIREKRT